MFCPTCGLRIDGAGGLCPHCRTKTTPGPGYAAAGVQGVVVVKSHKDPGIAAVLSFFYCGLGQIYNGEIGKGVLLLVVYFVSLMSIFFVVGLITTPILWLYGMFDAYKTAERLNTAGATMRLA